ncbi:MAG: hypothetical protein RLZZ158_1585 [Cyanobacteriota bacterium]
MKGRFSPPQGSSPLKYSNKMENLSKSFALYRAISMGSVAALGLSISVAAQLPIQASNGPAVIAEQKQKAVFAGGCFWSVEHALEKLPGVSSVTVGYSGGKLNNPSYEDVSTEQTGHQESVEVKFNPKKISYATLLRNYLRNIDALDGTGQFTDRGDSYRPVIFTNSSTQKSEAEASIKAAAIELRKPASAIGVKIENFKKFWPAESYHQNYADRNPIKYNRFRWGSGRDKRLNELWGALARLGNPWQTTTRSAKSLKF